MITRKTLIALPLAAFLGATAFGQAIDGTTPLGPANGPSFPLPPLPPDVTDAGGKNVPNLGMHHIKMDGAALPSPAIFLPAGTVVPTSPAPMGLVIGGIYLADAFGDVPFDSDGEYPQALWHSNTDPSGSLDETAMDGSEPIHFNLHYPQKEAHEFWLDEAGFDPSSPNDDLQEILDEIVATGSKARIAEALDILLGTNTSGALDDKVYNGFELLKYKGRKDNQTFDETTRNIEITQLWYDTEILSSHNMLKVPAHGDYTITWRIRGLGDIGPNREFAFPIDEFTPMPMKETGNSLFWKRNSWIWKWFDVVGPDAEGRKYSLEELFELHTGTPLDGMGMPVQTYQDIDSLDARYWLRANRKFDLGSYVGQDDITDLTPWHQYDLDFDGQIGGYLVNGTDTGSEYDEATNPDAQFNVYGNSETTVPLIDWSQGPYNIPHFAYDSSFNTIRKGKGHDVVIRYGTGEMQAGLYNWGWRVHPPRINWIETYAEGQYLASGAPKDWRFGHKWDQFSDQPSTEDALALIGDFAPEKAIYNALVDYDADSIDQSQFTTAVDGMMKHVRDRRGLPPTPGVMDFPNPMADINFLYTNLDMYGDRDTISAAGSGTWKEQDVISITVHNNDKVTRFFRVVDFGTTDYQYNGTDMGLLDWKPVFGFPQFAGGAWGGLFGHQGFSTDFWATSDIAAEGNPFYVSPNENDPANYWPAGTRDLLHFYDDLSGFSGPGFHSVQLGVFTVWGNNQLSGKATSDPNLWAYSYGEPIPPDTTRTFQVEMPRSAALNNGAMYMFDPQFHFSSIFTMHPESELRPEGLDD